jgi:hypothetical protein
MVSGVRFELLGPIRGWRLVCRRINGESSDPLTWVYSKVGGTYDLPLNVSLEVLRRLAELAEDVEVLLLGDDAVCREANERVALGRAGSGGHKARRELGGEPVYLDAAATFSSGR